MLIRYTPNTLLEWGWYVSICVLHVIDLWKVVDLAFGTVCSITISQRF